MSLDYLYGFFGTIIAWGLILSGWVLFCRVKSIVIPRVRRCFMETKEQNTEVTRDGTVRVDKLLAVGVTIGLILGNIIFQVFRPSHDPVATALDRSFFQVIAVVVVLWCARVK